MPAANVMLAVALLLALGASACSSATDITRDDDEVEEWVAEQQAEEKDRKIRPTRLPTPPAAAPAAPKPAPAPAAPKPAGAPCTAQWYEHVEGKLHVADAQGHGPDLGSAEWKSAVEHKLGVKDDASFPELGTPTWCERVEQLVKAHN